MKYGRFYGDGRRVLEALPRHVRKGSTPLRIRRAECRRIIDAFERSGTSHSPQCGTLWVVLEYCAENNITVELHVHSIGAVFARKRPQ